MCKLCCTFPTLPVVAMHVIAAQAGSGVADLVGVGEEVQNLTQLLNEQVSFTLLDPGLVQAVHDLQAGIYHSSVPHRHMSDMAHSAGEVAGWA